MYIREIEIENVRGFGAGEQGVHLDLTRPDGSLAGWTVIAGRNGTGKSTLLRAIALAVAGPGFAAGIQMQEGFAGWIRRGASAARVRVILERGPMDFPLGETQVTPISPELHWHKAQGETEPTISHEPRHYSAGPWAPNPRGWMIAGYGPFRRIGLRDEYVEPGPIMMSSLRSLFDAEAVLNEPIRWMETLYTKWLGLRMTAEDAKGAGDAEKARLLEDAAERHNSLIKGVLALLNDGLLPDDTRVIRFEIDGLRVERGGIELSLSSLSDGYRAAIALVIDLAYRLLRCYGELSIVEEELSDGTKRVTLPYDGVALIDEMESHFHVEWQKRIGFWLKERFPRIQFIVTTHSPFICQAADPGGIIRLAAPGEAPGAAHVSEDTFNTVVNGDVDDAVMTALFGLERPHSEKAEALRTRVAKLEVRAVRGLATPEELEELKQLSEKLPKTGSALVEQTLRKLKEGS